MKRPEPFRAMSFNLHDLRGISDRTVEMHYSLYEGYVKAANTLNEQIIGFLEDGKVDQEEMPAYSELTRRLGFEYNGMVLHEQYFGNLKKDSGGHPGQHSSTFFRLTEDSFGSFDRWKTDFTSVGAIRGVGWAICYLNPTNSRLSNHWISLHEHGHIAGFVPVLVMDVWEHAYLLDYKPSERASYIEAFFFNIDWRAVEQRLQLGVSSFAQAGRG